MDRGPGLQAKGRASQGSGSPDNAADITTDAFEEAELLRLQNDFYSGKLRPAAQVTRVGHKTSSQFVPASGGLESRHEQQAMPTAQEAAAAPSIAESYLPNMTDILADVKENMGSKPVHLPTASCEGSAFPKAMHRKLSKFALSRQQKPSAANGTAETTLGHQPPMVMHNLTDKTEKADAAKAQQLSPALDRTSTVNTAKQKLTAASRASMPTPSLDVSSSDQGQIDAENRQLIESMTPAELADAQQDVLSRLSPGLQSFFARRAAAKQSTRMQVDEAAGTAAHGIAGRPAVSLHQPAVQKPNSTAAASMTSFNSTASAALPQQPPAAAQQQSSSVVSRLRFSLAGDAIELKPDSADHVSGLQEQQVVQRDIIRQSEGALPEGYTLQEACMLVRSSQIKQRVLALKLLTATLSNARPQPSDISSLGLLQPRAMNTSGLSLQGTGSQLPSWHEVWEHALQHESTATVLRLALDDPQTSVVCAAAEALATFIGPGPQEQHIWQAAVDNPRLCSPMVAWRYCARPHAVGAWVTNPFKKDTAAPNPGQLVEEQASDHDSLAMVDPLVGLASMQILDRISFLLRSAQHTSACTPLLNILHAYSRAGIDAAKAVWQCPGMQQGLSRVLRDSPGDASNAMAVVRQLGSVSPEVMPAIAASGLMMHAHKALATPLDVTTDPSGQAQRIALQVQALQLWQSCADHNIFFMHMDDAFAAIWPLFNMSSAHQDPSEEGASTWPASKAELLQQVMLQGTCQAYLLLAALLQHGLRHPQNAMLSPGAASSLVNAALEWCQSTVPDQLRTSLKSAHDSKCARSELLSALAAVLSFLNAHIKARQAEGDITAVAAATSSWLHNLQQPGDAFPLARSLVDWLALDATRSESACELLAAIEDLTETLHRHKALQTCLHKQLSRCIIKAVSKQVVGPVPSPVEMQPWLAMWHQQRLPVQRLLLRALEHVTDLAEAGTNKAAEGEVSGLALSVPTYVPPGSETAALRAMSTAFRPVSMGPVLASACQAVQRLQAGASPLALAAAGFTFQQMQNMRCDSTSVSSSATGQISAALDVHRQAHRPAAAHLNNGESDAAVDPVSHQQHEQQYITSSALPDSSRDDYKPAPTDLYNSALYPPSQLPGQEACCEALLHGYSSAWLGLVPAPSSPHQALSESHAAAPSSLLEPAGSRLPLPLMYPWLEVCSPVPQRNQNQPGSASDGKLEPIPEEDETRHDANHATAQHGSGILAIACALMLMLGWEELEAPSCIAATSGTFKHVMDLVFGPEAAADVGASQEPWRFGDIRWLTAALLQRLQGEGVSLADVIQEDALKWTESFAADSFGDSLFALALSPLTGSSVSAPVKDSVMQMLQDERCQHLLPPTLA